MNFALKTPEEIERFESLLDHYTSNKFELSPKHLSLSAAYEYLQGDPQGPRIFTALLDVHISYHLLLHDIISIASTWNRLFSKGKLEGGSALDSPEKFFGKMYIHRFSTAYVLRYRAIWDKLMGLFILIHTPTEYESFMGGRSRKNRFFKLAAQHNILNEPDIIKIRDLLNNFDDSFRTAEAHGTGVLRKYTFTMGSMADNPKIELVGYWNALNEFIAEFGKKLSVGAKPR